MDSYNHVDNQIQGFSKKFVETLSKILFEDIIGER